jgi:hypothetical protein
MKAKQTDDPVDIGDLCSDLRLAEKNRRTIHIKRSPRIEIYKEYQRGNTYKYVLATHYPNHGGFRLISRKKILSPRLFAFWLHVISFWDDKLFSWLYGWSPTVDEKDFYDKWYYFYRYGNKKSN